MPQFFVEPEDVAGGSFVLSGPEAHHVVRVMRLGVGAALTLFDGKGGRFDGVIEAIGDDGAVRGRASKAEGPAAAAATLTLYLGLLKAGPWDYALEKGTELGVSRFVPLLTPRTVVLLHEVERAKSKAERWGRVVMAAAKQCGRADLPTIGEPVQFRDAMRALKGRGPVLLAYEGLRGTSATDVLRPALEGVSGEVSLFIGPEGGFSGDEVELARADGAVIFGLGPRILRAETAALAAAALVQSELGAM